MKTTHIILILLIAMLCGCNNCDEEVCLNDTEHGKNLFSSKHINTTEAIEIANKVMKVNNTRNAFSNIPLIECVTAKNQTRNTTQIDTVAYILNYPNNEGFVIVSSSKSVYPVLAFSQEGNFNFENTISKESFIDNLENYISNANPTEHYEYSEGDLDGCYVVEPTIKISIGQHEPWNKYVVKEHPDCPVGCVAVATALVMAHSKENLTYHGTSFNFKMILNGIRINNPAEDDIQSNSYINTLSLPGYEESYPYNTAVDYMAKLLYWIGQDVNMNYTENVSTAIASKAYSLCKSLNYYIPSGYVDYNVEDVINYLRTDHIIYLRGPQENDPSKGHAWVADACYLCVDKDDESKILQYYMHCDWGWSGVSNGYYTGAVFNTYWGNYKPSKYFAVKRNARIIENIIQ